MQPVALCTGFGIKPVFFPFLLLFSMLSKAQMNVVSEDPCHIQAHRQNLFSMVGSPMPSNQLFSKPKSRVQRLMKTAISMKAPSSHCYHSPNLSKASAIAWFFTMSMSPRPRQKWGKIKNTDFRISLMLFSF